MKNLSRRTLLKGALAGSAAVLLPSRGVLGANDDIRVAVVGFNSRGTALINGFDKLPGVRVVALCDVDPNVLAKQAAKFGKDGARKVFQCTDMRKLLDEEQKIDAIAFATPNHWHALQTIWSCQAGKDVYVEKPASHDIWEGQQMIAAAKKYNRIVQVGTQNRSDIALLEVVPYIREGNLGKVQWIRAVWFKDRTGIGDLPPHTPDWLDYDLWCGPSPLEPLRRKELHYDWHWLWRTGNGDLGNLGIHQFDVARWFLGDPGFPRRIISFGGRFDMNDVGETPNTQSAIFEYDQACVTLELRNLPTRKGARSQDVIHGTRENPVVKCEHGAFVGGRGGGWIYDNDWKKVKQYPGDAGGGHYGNFIDAVRSRKPEDLRASIAHGHVSTAIPLMANISYRAGSVSSLEKVKETAGNNPGVVEMLESFEKHLIANELNPNKITVGPWLTPDGESETIKSATGPDGKDLVKEANAQLKGTYREPYVVPEKV